jgi:hypothetical protein
MVISANLALPNMELFKGAIIYTPEMTPLNNSREFEMLAEPSQLRAGWI